MKLIVGNVKTKIVIGGSDNLLDVDIIAELRKYLRIRPKGYSFSPKYRKRQWDGWKYFITPKGEFATGFLPMVASYLTELGVEIEVEDIRGNIPVLNSELTNYIGEIDGKVWEATGKYEYQMDALASINNTIDIQGQKLYFPRGIFDCATNAGKNSLAALFMNNLPKDTEIIFMVSNTVIYNQAVEFFRQVLDGEELGEVKSGKCNPKRVTVCMVKTLLNRAKESLNIKTWLGRVGVLIVDESDEAGGNEYSTVLSWIGAGMRIFVSGTPLDGNTANAMVAIGLSGKVLYKITNRELIDKGVSQMPKIKVLLNNSGFMTIPTYEGELERFIHKSEVRVERIAEILRKHSEEQILITFVHKEHGEFMYNYLRENVHTDIAIVHGTTPDRDEILAQYKKGNIAVLLASMILKRGANIPIIRIGVLAHGGKSRTTTKQIIGRLIRHDGKNDDVIVYEFYDVGKFIGKHSRDRIRVYKEEGFEVEYDFPEKRGKPIL